MISVVVPNYNGDLLLRKNVPALGKLLEKSKLDYELIVVDDASTDESRGVIKEFGFKENDPSTSSGQAPSTRLRAIFARQNRGFASTADRGIREARGEIVFVVKSDSVPERADYFKLMLEHFNKVNKENKGVFAVSAALKTREGEKEEIRGCGEIYFEKGFFLHRRKLVTSNPSTLLKAGQQPVTGSWADGGAMAVRRDLYLKLGGFDPLFNPFYWEDVDLGYRAWKAGCKVCFEPKAILLHEHERGVIAKNFTKKQRRLISLRNQFIFLWKNADWKHLLLATLWWPYHGLVALKNGDGDFFRAHLQVKLKFLPILAARFRQNKLTILSDDRVLLFFRGKNRRLPVFERDGRQ